MSDLNYVDLEKGKVNVEVFTKTDAALAELQERFAVVPDCSTKEGYEFVKAGIKELTSLRTTLEAKRKEIKAPYLDAGKLVDTEAKRISSIIVDLEGPMKEAKKEQDEIEKRKKEERIARLQKKVDAIYLFVDQAKQAENSTAMIAIIEQVDALNVDDDYYDLTKEAQDAKQAVQDQIGELYTERLNTERMERERKAAEAKAAQARQEQEAMERKIKIKEKIMSLREIPMDMTDEPSGVILAKIAELKAFDMESRDWGEQKEDAMAAYEKTLTQLNKLHKMAVLEEAEKAAEEPAPEVHPEPELEPEAPAEEPAQDGFEAVKGVCNDVMGDCSPFAEKKPDYEPQEELKVMSQDAAVNAVDQVIRENVQLMTSIELAAAIVNAIETGKVPGIVATY